MGLGRGGAVVGYGLWWLLAGVLWVKWDVSGGVLMGFARAG